MGKTDIETFRELMRDHREHTFIGKILEVGPADDQSAFRVKVEVMPDLRELICFWTSPFVGSDAGDFAEPDPGDLVIGVKIEGDDDQAFVIASLPNKTDKIPVEALGGHRVVKAKPDKDLFLITQKKLEQQCENLKIMVTQLAELTAANEKHTIEEEFEVIADKAYLTSTTETGIAGEKIYLGRAKGAVTEPLVLGLVLKGLLTTMIDTIDGLITQLSTIGTDLGTHTHICSLPTVASGPPQTAAVYTAFVTQIAVLQVTLLAAKASDVTGEGILSETAFTEK